MTPGNDVHEPRRETKRARDELLAAAERFEKQAAMLREMAEAQ